MRFVAGRDAVAELLVRAAGESSWPGRRGGAASTGSQRKQLAGALRRDGAKRQSVRKSCRSASDAAAASRKSLPLGDAAAASGRG